MTAPPIVSVSRVRPDPRRDDVALFRIGHAVTVLEALHRTLHAGTDALARLGIGRGESRGNRRSGQVLEDEALHAGHMDVQSADAHFHFGPARRRGEPFEFVLSLIHISEPTRLLSIS